MRRDVEQFENVKGIDCGLAHVDGRPEGDGDL